MWYQDGVKKHVKVFYGTHLAFVVFPQPLHAFVRRALLRVGDPGAGADHAPGPRRRLVAVLAQPRREQGDDAVERVVVLADVGVLPASDTKQGGDTRVKVR